jgi:hypothetical protein
MNEGEGHVVQRVEAGIVVEPLARGTRGPHRKAFAVKGRAARWR